MQNQENAKEKLEKRYSDYFFQADHDQFLNSCELFDTFHLDQLV